MLLLVIGNPMLRVPLAQPHLHTACPRSEPDTCNGDGAADGRSCRDRGPGMWVATGASELNYKSTFDVKWCDPRTSTNTDDLVVLAELKTKTAASSKLGGNNDQLGLVTDNFAVLTEQAIKLYGPTCACCALCLAQNMNLGCDGKGGGNSGGTQPMRVRRAGQLGGVEMGVLGWR